jgi:hypothetical protein
MSVNVIDPVTAIRRFEKNEVRDVESDPVHVNGSTTLMSHIAGQPETRKRFWVVQNHLILGCTIMDSKDKEKNERKITKFIHRWNTDKVPEQRPPC